MWGAMVHPCLALFAETCRQNQTGRASWDKYFQWPRQIFVVVRLLLLCWSSFHVLPMKLQKFYLHADVCACTAGGKSTACIYLCSGSIPGAEGTVSPIAPLQGTPQQWGGGKKRSYLLPIAVCCCRTAHRSGYRRLYGLQHRTAYRCCTGWAQRPGSTACLHRKYRTAAAGAASCCQVLLSF